MEPSSHRADLVLENIRGLAVEVLRVDGRHSDLEPGFDRVLVDVPCTGLVIAEQAIAPLRSCRP